MDALNIFIGGSGRSGTTIIGSCLEELNNSIYFIEPSIIIAPGGIVDLVNKKITCSEFCNNVLSRFRCKTIYGFRRKIHNKVYNLKGLYATESVIALTKELSKDCSYTNCLKFIRDYIALGTTYYGVNNFIYKTPNLICGIEFLQDLYPDMYFIHIIREPKDIYQSVLTYPWGPNNSKSFVKWYNRYMSEAMKQFIQLSNKNYMVVQMEDLVAEPNKIIGSILNKLNIYDNDLVVKCSSHISTKSSHIGRYKNEGDTEDHKYIDEKCSDLYNLWQSVINIR